MTCPDCEALRLRAETAEARIESVSGMTRFELVAHEEDKRRDVLKALETLVEEWPDCRVRPQCVVDAEALLVKAKVTP